MGKRLPAAAPRREFVAEAYERVRDLIVQGRLAPGARLIETELAQRLDMSRTPLRTALHLLTHEGYLESSSEGRQSRLWVVAPTLEDASEIFNILGEMEALATERAAALPDERRAKLAAELRTLNAAMRATATRRTPGPAETMRCDGEFHRAIVEAGAGRRLRNFHRSMKPQADRCFNLYYAASSEDILMSTDEHDTIIDAIAAGDAQAGRRAMKANWRRAGRRLAKSMSAFGERGVW
jgi:DNA-binding GntR family transcriptional regulator